MVDANLGTSTSSRQAARLGNEPRSPATSMSIAIALSTRPMMRTTTFMPETPRPRCSGVADAECDVDDRGIRDDHPDEHALFQPAGCFVREHDRRCHRARAGDHRDRERYHRRAVLLRAFDRLCCTPVGWTLLGSQHRQADREYHETAGQAQIVDVDSEESEHRRTGHYAHRQGDCDSDCCRRCNTSTLDRCAAAGHRQEQCRVSNRIDDGEQTDERLYPGDMLHAVLEETLAVSVDAANSAPEAVRVTLRPRWSIVQHTFAFEAPRLLVARRIAHPFALHPPLGLDDGSCIRKPDSLSDVRPDRSQRITWLCGG